MGAHNHTPPLTKRGVRAYLDEAEHVGLVSKAFWEGGPLSVFNTKEED